MVKKKDTEEEQKKKLVTEIILLMYPSIGINPPTRKETTLERENRERLEEAVDPSHTNNNPFTIHIESLTARLEKKSLEELAIILEERNKKADEHSAKIKNEFVSQVQEKIDMEKSIPGETDNLSIDMENIPENINKLLNDINNVLEGMKQGNKPESVRNIAKFIINYAEKCDKSFDRNSIPGKYVDFYDCVNKLTPSKLKISSATFKDYIKGKLGKCTDQEICKVTGKGNAPWPSLFPEIYKDT